ncbi:hypothetical protein GCM10027594_03630 [Hymenobacter agri]
MKRINVTAGSLLLLLSLISYCFGEKLAAAPFALLGLGILLSDLAYLPTRAPHPLRPSTLPAWRRYTSIGLITLAFALFGYRIVRDFTESGSATTSGQ